MAETDIAVVGMGCRLPGASDLDAFWRMLRDGRDARRELSDEHLRSVGVPDDVLADPDFVKAAMLLDDIDQFDAGFFGLSPRDASLFDPQHRIWLEVCWEAFEHAGHVPESFDGRVGVFAGCGMDTYLLHNVLTNPDLVRQIGMFLIRHTGNDKDFLATRTSYQFDLRGPSINVVTACSTSLVAIHQAAASLLTGECDMALAGGVTVLVPQDRGYLYKEGEVLSPDGACRSFDADSVGTIFGSGAGVVVLRRLQDALADGDHIHAVVAGSAVNNDGARKVSYLAPSVDGYAEVVAEALALSDVPAENVQYVEAHGTGTSVGDPIEIEALTQAFRASTSKSDFCGIGSVKTNIGHLDTAAGVAGVVKVALAMKHGEIPASLNYRRPNPLIDFAKTPFHVVADKAEWPRPAGGERTAGVSSLGVGGTNAHIIMRESLEQPAAPAVPYPRRCHLLPISGKNKDAAAGNAGRMAAWLPSNLNADLADVAWTMQHGRRAFSHRGFAVGADHAQLAESLLASDWKSQVKKASERAASVVFLFPGGGAQYPGMAKELYEFEPAFRTAADKCFAALPDETRTKVYELLFGAETQAENGLEMERPSLLLPTLFVVEYSLAETIRSFGVEPDAMLGHSLGEYVAATLGGTWTLEQVLPVLVLRGECMELSAAGAVVSVSLPAAEIQALGDAELSLSAANAPELSAVAGSPFAIERFEQSLKDRDVDFQRLRIGVGAHSHLLDSVLDRFREGLEQFTPEPAKKLWVSNVTGEWIDAQRAADRDYWVEHLRSTVRFEDGVSTLLDGGDRVFVEVGPGKALTSLVRMHERARNSSALVTVPHPNDEKPADSFLLEAIGRLWQVGVPIDWQAFHGGVKRRRVALPTYAFQRQRYWIEPGTSLGHDNLVANNEPTVPTRLPDSQWLKKTVWRAREVSSKVEPAANAHWLCVGGGAVAAALASKVRAAGGKATVVTAIAAQEHGTAEREHDDAWSLPFTDAAAWGRVVDAICKRSGDPTHVMFAAALDAIDDDAVALVSSQIAMFQALGRAGLVEGMRVVAVTSGATVVANETLQRPAQGAVPGMLRVLPREFPGTQVCWVDADAATLAESSSFADRVRLEAEASSAGMGVAFRDSRRFVQELVSVDIAEPVASPWRTGGTFLITGGLGGIGMLLAEHLARTCKAKLVLVSRRGLPQRANWDEWLQLRGGDRTAELIRRVRAMEQDGAVVEVAAADVTDRRAMQRVVQTATTRFGALHGVVHTAGVLDDGLILMRKPEQTERLMRPKIVGAQVLDEVTADIPLDQFIVFGSTSALVGIPGQCDYAAANAALDTFAEWRSQKRRGRTLSVDWGIWQDAGMLATAHELSLPVPAWLGDRSEQGGVIAFRSSWSPGSQWILAEHRIKGGDCVMPGTGHMELMIAAVQSVASAAQVTLAQVEFRTPLAFPGDAARTVIVSVKPHRDGWEVTVASCEPQHTQDHERTTHARAIAKAGAAGEALLDVAVRRAVAGDAVEVVSSQHRHVEFGPRWQCITSIAVGRGEVLGELSLPDEFFEDLEQHRVHPAMLDMAFGCGIRLLSNNSPDSLFVPVGCEQVLVHGRMPADVVSHVRATSYDEHSRLGTLDVTVATPSGVVVMELRGLSVFGVRGQFGGDVATTQSSTREVPVVAEPLPAAPVQRIDAILARGITGPEGMLSLERALDAGAARVVVSSLDVQRAANWLSLPPEQPRVQRAATSGATNTGTGSSAGEEDAPRDATEQAVAAAFAGLLGVESPRLDDDFFELGGHSLLAVRLFARLHKEFGIDMELATLLSAGTVRQLAAMLREELGLPEPSDEPVRSVAARKGQHVVPIQTEGSRPKLFLVHGAGGNVLGFRDLSHYFGKNQPLYGLQARGVDGKVEPHATIQEMAEAYLAELREVQPHGPYHLGGYSGGGVVAYEMAQLLRAVGEPVAFVGMIDSWCPQMKKRSKFSRAMLHIGRLIKKGPLYPWRIVKARIDRRAAARDTEKAREQGGALPQEQRGFEVQFAFENAFETHQIKPYEGDVWLFRADDQHLGTRFVFDAHLGWRPFVHGEALSVHACPGNHYTMCTEPNVQVLCQYMMQAIDVAIARSVSTSASTSAATS